ncbi:MAG: hypothetical protein AAGA62_00720, partial [Bacteroidota bacterium]
MTKTILRLLFFLPAASYLLLSCSDQRDIRDYYFPVRELTDGLVYAYENTGSLPGPDREYWYYLGVDLDTALHLSVTRYSPTMAPEQQGREEIRNDGVYLRDLTLLVTDSSGIATTAKATILYDRVFPFYLSPEATEAYGYRLHLRPPENPDATTFVTLNRRFRGDTSITLLGKAYPAIVFDLDGEVSLRDPEEGDISPQFTG